MKRLSNYGLFIGLIMAAVSIFTMLAYNFLSLELTTDEKLNLVVLYCIGTMMALISAACKLFKEIK